MGFLQHKSTAKYGGDHEDAPIRSQFIRNLNHTIIELEGVIPKDHPIPVAILRILKRLGAASSPHGVSKGQKIMGSKARVQNGGKPKQDSTQSLAQRGEHLGRIVCRAQSGGENPGTITPGAWHRGNHPEE